MTPMKVLRPSSIVLLGTLLVAPLFASMLLLMGGRSPDLHSLVWALGCGAGLGLGVLGPIAAMLLLAERRLAWVLRYAGRIGFYSSMVMALSMGYLIACFQHQIKTLALLAAMASLYLGAALNAGLHY